MFVPLLPFPLPGMQVAVEPLDHADRVTWIVIGVVAAAFFVWGFRRGTPTIRRLARPAFLYRSPARAESELS
jgi:hypothetical protein